MMMVHEERKNLEMLMILMVFLLRRNVLYSQVNKIYKFIFYSKFQSQIRNISNSSTNISHFPLPISGDIFLKYISL